MNINYNAITAWAAVGAAGVAIWAVLAESRRSRFAFGIDLILKMDERFNSSEMQKVRRTAAKSILDKTNTDADDVLDFFEMIGILTRRGALDKKMTWHTFFFWIHYYWCSAEEYIRNERQKDPTIWADLAYLHEQVVAIEKHERPCSDSEISLTQESITEFLTEESNLSVI